MLLSIASENCTDGTRRLTVSARGPPIVSLMQTGTASVVPRDLVEACSRNLSLTRRCYPFGLSSTNRWV